ncbi:MAG: glycosyltransferase family 4 protein [Phycisphaerae bacterium]|nr:glycosyltransferase family 4 protein [Phycisphaerae bacterium]
MRILHVIGSLGLGGAQVCLKQIAEYGCGDGVKHYIYPLRSKKNLISINAEILTKPYRNYDLRKFFAIIKFCRQYEIDVLHAHLEKPVIGCLLASFFCKAKIVVHEHGPVCRKNLRCGIYRFLFRLLQNRADAVVAVSENIKGELVKRIGLDESKVSVVYNSIDWKRFQVGVNVRSEQRKMLGIGDGQFVVGYFGRLNSVKGVDLFLKAIPLLLRQRNDIAFIVAGAGPMLAELKQYSIDNNFADKVNFTGFREDMENVYAVSDVAVVPSRQEPFGIAALECMASGVGIVSSGVDGLGEFLVDGQTALITKGNNPESIYQSVLTLIDNAELLRAIQTNALKESKKFGVETQMKQLNEIYSGLGCV